MKNLQIKILKQKKFFVSLFLCLFLLTGCGDLNYSLNTNITAGLDGKKSLALLNQISDLFLKYPNYFATENKIKDKKDLVDKLSNSLNPVGISSDVLNSLVQDKDSQGIEYRFLFDHYDSIYFYVGGSGSFINCDPSIDGIKYCVGYGGAIKIKKGDDYFWFYFNDVLNKNQDGIDKISEITEIIKA